MYIQADSGECPQSSEESIHHPVGRSTNGCILPKLSSENKTPNLLKSSKYFQL